MLLSALLLVLLHAIVFKLFFPIVSCAEIQSLCPEFHRRRSTKSRRMLFTSLTTITLAFSARYLSDQIARDNEFVSKILVFLKQNGLVEQVDFGKKGRLKSG